MTTIIVLIEDKIVSCMGSSVASYYAFYYFITILGLIWFLAFILLPGTQRMFFIGRLLLFLFFCCVHVCYRKKCFKSRLSA